MRLGRFWGFFVGYCGLSRLREFYWTYKLLGWNYQKEHKKDFL